MMKGAAYAFDHHAAHYDAQFTRTVVGRIQRRQVWSTIDRLRLPANLKVLELNCGTGEDAMEWKKRGAVVLATDISEEMVKQATTKFPDLPFEQLDIRHAGKKMQHAQLVFSNFGGFNCLPPDEIRLFFLEATRNLPSSATIVLVVMGKKCLWDRIYMIAKGRWGERNRRNTDLPLSVLVDGALVQTWYYSPKELKKIAGNSFHVVKTIPIGLAIPPSYLAPFLASRKFLTGSLSLLDRFVRLRSFSNFSDHFLIVFEKNG